MLLWKALCFKSENTGYSLLDQVWACYSLRDIKGFLYFFYRLAEQQQKAPSRLQLTGAHVRSIHFKDIQDQTDTELSDQQHCSNDELLNYNDCFSETVCLYST